MKSNCINLHLHQSAHVIRNPSTNQYRAVTGLTGLIRWCLTGTPIQNTLEDLGSLVTFLNVPILSEAVQFRRHISKQMNSFKGDYRPDFKNLRHLLGAICLRRNKAVLPVSQTEEYVHRVQLSRTERQAYERLGYSWKQAIELAVGGHKTKEAHQTVLEALLRMRIYCNNGDYLGDACASVLTEPDEFGSLLQQDGNGSCHYCACDVLTFSSVQDNSSGFATPCHHAVCSDCYERYMQAMRDHGRCPICGSHHTIPAAPSCENLPPQQAERQPFPPKIRILCDDIRRYMHQSKR